MKINNNTKVYEIKIIFRNLDTVLLNTKYINTLYFGGVKTILYLNHEAKDGEIKELYTCEEMFLEIDKKGFNVQVQMVVKENYALEKRLELFQDIFGIILFFEDETEKIIYVPWEDDNKTINSYQNSKKMLNEENKECIRIKICK